MADAARPLDWYTIVRTADWQTPQDVRRTFGTASFARDVVIFNIGSNTYRLAVNVRYQFHAVYVRRMMTHEEYDEDDLYACAVPTGARSNYRQAISC